VSGEQISQGDEKPTTSESANKGIWMGKFKLSFAIRSLS
jgi:hypothetical protein